jgi:6-phosphogluconolactonase (cycloisomerase 2 family)
VTDRRRRAIAYVSGGPLRLPRRAYVLAALGLAGLGGIVAVFVLRTQPVSAFDGFVYVESNHARRGANSVLAYRFRHNRLALIGEFPTRGTGTVDPAVTGSLDAEGQIAFDRTRRLLFAVNQGSDSIAVFRIARDGRLTTAPGSPFSSIWPSPASVAVSGDLLVVADKAHDPARRRLESVRPAYTTFRIADDGRLSSTGWVVRVVAGASPTQVLVLPGHVVVASEEAGGAFGGPFRGWLLRPNGELVRGPNSPLALDNSIFRAGYIGARWAIGLVGNPKAPLLYGNQSNTHQLLVYRYSPSGRLEFVRSLNNSGARLPCWTTVSRDGRFLYTANAGNGSVSVFSLAVPDEPRQLQLLHLRRGANPWGLALDPSGKTLFVVDPRAVAGVPEIVGNRLHVLAVRRDGRLDEIDDARVKLPVSGVASPLGIAVVPRT